MVDMNFGVSSEDIEGANGTVVELPNLISGKLADFLSNASGPVQQQELTWEHGARTAFRAANVSWPKPQRRLHRSPAVVAIATVASLLVTTTSLAAATGLPAPAARVVDRVLNRVGIPVTPPAVGHQGSLAGVIPMLHSSNLSVGAVGARTHTHAARVAACSTSQPASTNRSNGSTQSGRCSVTQVTSGIRAGAVHRNSEVKGRGNLGTGVSQGANLGTGVSQSGNQGTGTNRGRKSGDRDWD
jgi:hypothetical protein